MLSSIHPLGERGRGNRWALTVAAFTLGSVGSGATVGASLGTIGLLLQPTAVAFMPAVAASAVAAVALDAIRIRPPGPSRQVNERWIGAFRGWVYGFSFGAQLGAGAATYVVTWLVYAAAIAALAAGSPTAGSVVGAVFGLGRAVPMLMARWVNRPSRLPAFHRRMAALGPPVRIASMVIGGLAAVTSLGVLF